MSRYAIIHPASGAIVMVTTVQSMMAPDHLDRRPAPAGVDPATHWWDGWSFRPRVDADISAAIEGETVVLDYPAEAWVAAPDGTISSTRTLPRASERRRRIVLVGRYRGDLWIEPGDAA
ncbi:MAG: hypothetical protein WBL20_10310 [Sphingobium sp.]|uniref:hypothetical protein n=1 Tax=Sphingobium sp. TaxID=1912891 RepID=UPI002E1D9170